MSYKRIFTVIMALVLISLLLSCSLFGGDRVLLIVAYPDCFNPGDITADSNIYSLLRITPAINGKTLFLTNSNGELKFKDIPAGVYTIHPVFVAASYDRTVSFPEDTKIEIAYPSAGIVCAAINVNSDVPELQDANVRSALASAITRSDLLANTSTNGNPANFLIPWVYYGNDGMDSMEGVSEANPVNAMLQNDDPFSFEFLHPDTRAAMAEEIKTQWEAVDKVVTVTTVSKDYEAFKTDFTAKNFDAARWGWVLDSNNLLSYLKKVASVSGFTDATLAGHFDAAAAAIAADDLAAHVDRIKNIVSYLNNRMCTIPLYFFNP